MKLQHAIHISRLTLAIVLTAGDAFADGGINARLGARFGLIVHHTDAAREWA